MSIEKFLNRLRYGFYTIESIETRAERRIGFTTHGELFEKYITVFKRESFIRKTLWAIFAYAMMVVFFAYFFVSIALFFMS